MSVLMIVTIIVFNALNNDSAINAVYSLASYTYGPILGMFVFGMACKKPVNDKLVPVVCIADRSSASCFRKTARHGSTAIR